MDMKISTMKMDDSLVGYPESTKQNQGCKLDKEASLKDVNDSIYSFIY